MKSTSTVTIICNSKNLSIGDSGMKITPIQPNTAYTPNIGFMRNQTQKKPNTLIGLLFLGALLFFFSNIGENRSLCVFFVCFFFPRKSSYAIHSFDFTAVFFSGNEKKNSFFIHSFEIHQKCTKKISAGEIKKYDTFALIFEWKTKLIFRSEGRQQGFCKNGQKMLSKKRYRKINAFFHFYRKINAFDILNKPFLITTKPFYREINVFFHLYRKSNAFVILMKSLEISNKTFNWPSLFIAKSMRFSISIAKSMHLLYSSNSLKFRIKP